MIFLKKGVQLLGPNNEPIHPVWHEFALKDIEDIFFQHMSPCVITSAWDGKHMAESAHYDGRGLDFRTRMVKMALRATLTRRVRDILGVDFDVVFEEDHLHVEYDPKR